jgi:hypothetical protein
VDPVCRVRYTLTTINMVQGWPPGDDTGRRNISASSCPSQGDDSSAIVTPPYRCHLRLDQQIRCRTCLTCVFRLPFVTRLAKVCRSRRSKIFHERTSLWTGSTGRSLSDQSADGRVLWRMSRSRRKVPPPTLEHGPDEHSWRLQSTTIGWWANQRPFCGGLT